MLVMGPYNYCMNPLLSQDTLTIITNQTPTVILPPRQNVDLAISNLTPDQSVTRVDRCDLCLDNLHLSVLTSL